MPVPLTGRGNTSLDHEVRDATFPCRMCHFEELAFFSDPFMKGNCCAPLPARNCAGTVPAGPPAASARRLCRATEAFRRRQTMAGAGRASRSGHVSLPPGAATSPVGPRSFAAGLGLATSASPRLGASKPECWKRGSRTWREHKHRRGEATWSAVSSCGRRLRPSPPSASSAWTAWTGREAAAGRIYHGVMASPWPTAGREGFASRG